MALQRKRSSSPYLVWSCARLGRNDFEEQLTICVHHYLETAFWCYAESLALGRPHYQAVQRKHQQHQQQQQKKKKQPDFSPTYALSPSPSSHALPLLHLLIYDHCCCCCYYYYYYYYYS